MKTLKSALKIFFRKATVNINFVLGERGSDGYAFVFQNGQKTNTRSYIWDADQFQRLQKIGERLHHRIRRNKTPFKKSKKRL